MAKFEYKMDKCNRIKIAVVLNDSKFSDFTVGLQFLLSQADNNTIGIYINISNIKVKLFVENNPVA